MIKRIFRFARAQVAHMQITIQIIKYQKNEHTKHANTHGRDEFVIMTIIICYSVMYDLFQLSICSSNHKPNSVCQRKIYRKILG